MKILKEFKKEIAKEEGVDKMSFNEFMDKMVAFYQERTIIDVTEEMLLSKITVGFMKEIISSDADAQQPKMTVESNINEVKATLPPLLKPMVFDTKLPFTVSFNEPNNAKKCLVMHMSNDKLPKLYISAPKDKIQQYKKQLREMYFSHPDVKAYLKSGSPKHRLTIAAYSWMKSQKVKLRSANE